MFRGTIPAEMRSILREIVGRWGVSDVAVGCSGNFTVERALHGVATLHGNDVTLYSCALGSYFAQQPQRLEVREQYRETFDFIVATMTTPAMRTASMMLASSLMGVLDSKGNLKPVAYYQRQLAAYRQRWPAMVEKMATKLESSALRLGSFFAGDVVEWLPQVDKSAGFVTYPPFFSGDYEAMFHKLDLLFEWDKPAYSDIGDAHVEPFLAAVTDRPFWAFGTNRKIDAFDQYLRGMTQTTNRGVTIYLYASQGTTRIVTPRQEIAPAPGRRLTPGMEIGEALHLVELTTPQFSSVRSQYMNPGIKPGLPTRMYGVYVDDVLIGAYALSFTPPSKAFMTGGSTIYLLSDFPVEPTDYERLAKLVLYAALSKESKLLAERTAHHRIRQLYTTAFSNNPVSMKYRGLFELHTRKENKNAPAGDDDPTRYYEKRYQLNYTAEMGQWSLTEGLALWRKKHGRRTERAAHTDRPD